MHAKLEMKKNSRKLSFQVKSYLQLALGTYSSSYSFEMGIYIDDAVTCVCCIYLVVSYSSVLQDTKIMQWKWKLLLVLSSTLS